MADLAFFGKVGELFTLTSLFCHREGAVAVGDEFFEGGLHDFDAIVMQPGDVYRLGDVFVKGVEKGRYRFSLRFRNSVSRYRREAH